MLKKIGIALIYVLLLSIMVYAAGKRLVGGCGRLLP